MNILIVGSGGRCHAIAHSLSKSPLCTRLFLAPGNAGMASLGQCVPIKDTQVDELLSFAKENSVDLTVVGPEASLALGIVDRFRGEGLRIFGPTKDAARIESSKRFAKDLMKRHSIPTAAYEVFDDYDAALSYVKERPFPAVIKYDGLAAGKGVVIAKNMDEAEKALSDMLLDSRFGKGKVVVEEFLTGPEFSLLCFVSGEKVYPMPCAQDHKRAFDGDEGPNTGGMGAYTPLPFITREDEQFALHGIMEKTAKAMVEEGCPFTGVLYGGLMKTPSGIKVIEFNARFGDPETEVILPCLESDLARVFIDICDGNTPSLEWSSEACLGIVLASKGYPGSYEKGFPIEGLDKVEGTVYHMGTALSDGKVVTSGGRVAIVVEKAPSLSEARERALSDIGRIRCGNLFFRHDIAHWAIDGR